MRGCDRESAEARARYLAMTSSTGNLLGRPSACSAAAAAVKRAAGKRHPSSRPPRLLAPPRLRALGPLASHWTACEAAGLAGPAPTQEVPDADSRHRQFALSRFVLFDIV